MTQRMSLDARPNWKQLGILGGVLLIFDRKAWLTMPGPPPIQESTFLLAEET